MSSSLFSTCSYCGNWNSFQWYKNLTKTQVLLNNLKNREKLLLTHGYFNMNLIGSWTNINMLPAIKWSMTLIHFFTKKKKFFVKKLMNEELFKKAQPLYFVNKGDSGLIPLRPSSLFSQTQHQKAFLLLPFSVLISAPAVKADEINLTRRGT